MQWSQQSEPSAAFTDRRQLPVYEKVDCFGWPTHGRVRCISQPTSRSRKYGTQVNRRVDTSETARSAVARTYKRSYFAKIPASWLNYWLTTPASTRSATRAVGLNQGKEPAEFTTAQVSGGVAHMPLRTLLTLNPSRKQAASM